MNPDTLITVHGYSGDAHQMTDLMPWYLHHQCPVAILTPTDSPVTTLRGANEQVSYHHAGKVGYIGQVSLDRQIAQMKYLLAKFPHKFFLMNDSDSVCLIPKLPRYLYETPTIMWSNEVREPRPHISPYPKIACQPPYFMTRETMAKLVAVPPEKWAAHPITPFIDYQMLVLPEESDVLHMNFPDGQSNGTGDSHGQHYMALKIAQEKKVFVHSIKSLAIMKQILRAADVSTSGKKVAFVTRPRGA